MPSIVMELKKKPMFKKKQSTMSTMQLMYLKFQFFSFLKDKIQKKLKGE